MSATLDSGFDAFWQAVQKNFKALPIKERNFRKRIGIAPDITTARQAYEILKQSPPEQLLLFIHTHAA